MIEITHLLSVADAYRLATGVEDTTVSYRVFGDTKKLGAMRAGADVTVGRFNDAMVWFSTHWPEGAQWPEAVVRPTVDATPAPAAAE